MRKILISITKVIIGIIVVGAIVLLFILQFSQIGTTIEVLKSLTEIAAIIIGGLWTYNRFIKTREDYPYLKINHDIKYYDLENSFIYLSAFVTVTNEGKTKLDLSSGTIVVRQVLPLSSRIGDLIEMTNDEDVQLGKNTANVNKLFIDDAQRIGWDTLGSRSWEDRFRETLIELEPKQTREIQFDFLFNSQVDVIEIISHFKFGKSTWELATLHSVIDAQGDTGIRV